MRKRIPALVLAALLLLLVPVSAATTALPPLPVFDSAEGLHTVSYDLEIDEAAGTLRGALLLRNVSAAEHSGSFTLPDEGLAADPESISVRSAGVTLTRSGGSYSLTLPAGACAYLQWSFDTVNLRNMKVISCDLNALPRCEGGRIDRVTARMLLSEEDIPLVTEVTPVNYTFDGSAVEVCLYDFAPSRLLDKICLTKETWQNLASGREFEPNEAQLFLTRSYRKWLADSSEILSYDWVGDWFDAAMGLNLGTDDRYDRGYYSLWDNNPIYTRAADYFYYRARMLADPADNSLAFSLTTDYSDSSQYLLSDWYCTLTGDSRARDTFAVSYAFNPSLADIPLSAKVTLEYGWDEELQECVYETEIIPVDEKAALRTDVSATHKSYSCALSSHVAEIPADSGASAEEILDFAEAIGAKMLIRVQLFDGIHGQFPTVTDEYLAYDEFGNEIPGEVETVTYPASLVLGYCGEENRELAENACGQYGAEWAGDSYQVRGTEDEVLRKAQLPAFLMYRGFVYEEDGAAMVEFSDAHYRSWDTGLSRYPDVAATERGAALAEAAELRRAETAKTAEAEIQDLVRETGTALTEPETAPEPAAPAEPESPAEPEAPAVTELPEPETENTGITENTEQTEPAPVKETGASPLRVLVPVLISVGGALLAAAAVIMIIAKKRGKKQ